MLHGYERAKRNHVTGGIACLEADDILSLQAEARLGLRSDCVGASERIEVVDVE